MAPAVASTVVRLYRSSSDTAVAEIIPPNGSVSRTLEVSSLDISTVRRIGKIVGVGATLGMDGGTLRRVVSNRCLSFVDENGGEWLRSMTVPVSVPVSVPVPVVDPADSALKDALELIADAFGTKSSATIDEEAVRRIVADALANRPAADRIDVHVSGTLTGSITGHRHAMFDEVAFCLSNGMHVYLGGPAGTGKSFTAIQASESVGLSVRGVITGNPMLTESRVFGYMNAHGDYIDTSGLYDAYKNGGVFLVDEIDNASPNVTVMLNTLMASDRYTFPNGESVDRHASFRIVATANTFGTGPTAAFAGRFPLDPSTLDRFEQLMMDYDKATDRYVAERVAGADSDRVLTAAWAMRASIDGHGLRGFVTPRGIDRACRFMAGGFPWSRVVECLMPAGMTDGQRRQILENVKGL